MADDRTDGDLGFDIEDEDGEFDPFFEGDLAEETDEGGIEEIPELTELPPEVRRHGAYDAEKFDCAEDAIEALLKHNPGRTPVFLRIVEECAGERPMGEVEDVVAEAQASNYSVYSAATLCRMLERSGALTSRVPESVDEVVEEDGVEYLQIKDAGETMWTATDAGLAVVAAHREGAGVADLLAREADYEPVYRKLLEFCSGTPRTKKEIDALIDPDPLVQHPRLFAAHFIEQLERNEAMAWVGGRWTLTELGERVWERMR